MAVVTANVNPSVDSWATLISRLNTIAYNMSSVVLTASANTTGAITTGNAVVSGSFNAGTLVANTVRGGTITTPAALTVTSNAAFTGGTLTSSANVNFTGANTTIGGRFIVSGNSAFNANVTIGALSTFSANAAPSANGVALGSTAARWNLFANSADLVSVSSSTVTATSYSLGAVGNFEIFANTNLTTAGSNKVIASLPLATYRSGKFTITAGTPAGDYQTSDTIVVQNGTDVAFTTGGIVFSNSQFYTVDSVVNGANVDIRVLPTVANVAIKVVAQLTKV